MANEKGLIEKYQEYLSAFDVKAYLTDQGINAKMKALLLDSGIATMEDFAKCNFEGIKGIGLAKAFELNEVRTKLLDGFADEYVTIYQDNDCILQVSVLAYPYRSYVAPFVKLTSLSPKGDSCRVSLVYDKDPNTELGNALGIMRGANSSMIRSLEWKIRKGKKIGENEEKPYLALFKGQKKVMNFDLSCKVTEHPELGVYEFSWEGMKTENLQDAGAASAADSPALTKKLAAMKFILGMGIINEQEYQDLCQYFRDRA